MEALASRGGYLGSNGSIVSLVSHLNLEDKVLPAKGGIDKTRRSERPTKPNLEYSEVQ